MFMNWYKKIYSVYEKMFTVRELITRFNAYNVTIIGSTSGSRHTLMNKNNGQYTNFHYHKLGEMIPKGKLENMLKGLGIDYHEFTRFKKPIDQITKNPIKQKDQSWKNDKWYQNYLKNIEINNLPKTELKNELV